MPYDCGSPPKPYGDDTGCRLGPRQRRAGTTTPMLSSPRVVGGDPVIQQPLLEATTADVIFMPSSRELLVGIRQFNYCCSKTAALRRLLYGSPPKTCGDDTPPYAVIPAVVVGDPVIKLPYDCGSPPKPCGDDAPDAVIPACCWRGSSNSTIVARSTTADVIFTPSSPRL